jgi:topoisomerase-4 subunit B
MVHFWPDASYFDSNKVSVLKLKHVLRAKAVLCPGLKIRLILEQGEETFTTHFLVNYSDDFHI